MTPSKTVVINRLLGHCLATPTPGSYLRWHRIPRGDTVIK